MNDDTTRVSEELPPPVRGGSADRQSAEQRQAAMNAPMIYIKSGSAASLRRAMAAIETLPGDATADEVVEAIRAEEPELADAINPAVSRSPRGWTSHQWAMFLIGLYIAFVNTFGSPAQSELIPTMASITGEHMTRIGDVVRDIVEGGQDASDEDSSPGPGGVPKSE